MSSRLFYLTAAFALALSACPAPRPPPTPGETDGDYPTPPDNSVEEFPDDSPAGLSSPCGKACDNLRRVPCREGFPTATGVSCYRGCLSMARQQRVPTSCWASKKTPEDVRACGGIRCLSPQK